MIMLATNYICNVLHIWHIRVIPIYRVYRSRLYDNIVTVPVITSFKS